MKPRLKIQHRSKHRVRLQLASTPHLPQKALEPLIEDLRKQGRCRLQFRPLTQSLILEGDLHWWDDYQSQVLSQKWQILEAMSPQANSESFWEHCQGSLDQKIRQISGGHLNLKGTLGLGFAVLGLNQWRHGAFLPAGLTLMMYASGFWKSTPRSSHRNL